MDTCQLETARDATQRNYYKSQLPTSHGYYVREKGLRKDSFVDLDRKPLVEGEPTFKLILSLLSLLPILNKLTQIENSNQSFARNLAEGCSSMQYMKSIVDAHFEFFNFKKDQKGINFFVNENKIDVRWFLAVPTMVAMEPLSS
ncbi:hypothetical protein Fmac_007830 [Flemingia macrophylla]|uniref:Uncharacterized protein n=1 Tax=Flemingia macrophylla TaxID=520843 RepID=A0ABD1MY15_9FABA